MPFDKSFWSEARPGWTGFPLDTELILVWRVRVRWPQVGTDPVLSVKSEWEEDAVDEDVSSKLALVGSARAWRMQDSSREICLSVGRPNLAGSKSIT